MTSLQNLLGKCCNKLLIYFIFAGCQHAPGIGRAVSELVIDSQYTTIDLTRFGFDRLLIDERSIEFNVY